MFTVRLRSSPSRENGLWLRQGDANAQSVIHALRVARQGMHLEDVIVFLYSGGDKFLGRIDAQSAQLAKADWRSKTPG